MIRWLAFVVLLLSIGFGSAAELESSPLRMRTLKVGSQVFNNVTIVGANATDLYFTHDKGITNVKLKYLEPDMQKEFHYDADAAATAERQQAEQDVRFQESIAAEISAKAAAAAAAVAAAKLIITSEESLADPISEKSLLGKEVPPLEIEKWLGDGDPPTLTEKNVLVLFWVPWSIPCRKAIPALNTLQKAFTNNLQIVALTSSPAADVLALTEPRMDFASAIDSKGKIQAAFNVTSAPHVVLLDPKRIVLYEGHPAPLTDKTLQPLLAKSSEEK